MPSIAQNANLPTRIAPSQTTSLASSKPSLKPDSTSPSSASATETLVYSAVLADNGDPQEGKSVRPLLLLPSVPIHRPRGRLEVGGVINSTDVISILQLLRLPPPTTPYVLRITIDAGTAASRNGVLHTNFPLPGKEFVRENEREVA